jgi:hypothetical protein
MERVDVVLVKEKRLLWTLSISEHSMLPREQVLTEDQGSVMDVGTGKGRRGRVSSATTGVSCRCCWSR